MGDFQCSYVKLQEGKALVSGMSHESETWMMTQTSWYICTGQDWPMVGSMIGSRAKIQRIFHPISIYSYVSTCFAHYRTL
jgi:hypothetical protein